MAKPANSVVGVAGSKPTGIASQLARNPIDPRCRMGCYGAGRLMFDNLHRKRTLYSAGGLLLDCESFSGGDEEALQCRTGYNPLTSGGGRGEKWTT